jgi:Fic-DOC domain mobile mystery protein B
MKSAKLLQLRQLDERMSSYKSIPTNLTPENGWIKTLRTSLDITLEQLGEQMDCSKQSVLQFEKSEASGSITLKKLKDLGEAMGLELVYGFVPKVGSLETLYERMEEELQQKISNRASQTAELSDINTSRALSDKQRSALKFSSITTEGALLAFEQINIEKAMQWMMQKKFKREEILSEAFIKNIHKRMFEEVWTNAGKYRTHNTEFGEAPENIETAIQQLITDTNTWIDTKTYAADEIAIRFKHRLASIHAFGNGNGRHSRIMADIIIQHIFKRELFSWNKTNLHEASTSRTEYINAMKLADQGNVLRLLGFARN